MTSKSVWKSHVSLVDTSRYLCCDLKIHRSRWRSNNRATVDGWDGGEGLGWSCKRLLSVLRSSPSEELYGEEHEEALQDAHEADGDSSYLDE